jgi:hypothetical protein
MTDKIVCDYYLACKTSKVSKIWETFEYTKQTDYDVLSAGLSVAAVHKQINSLKALACLVRDEDFHKDITKYLFYYLERAHVEFCYEFIPSLAKTKYFHETPWFRCMFIYMFENKNLHDLIVNLF